MMQRRVGCQIQWTVVDLEQMVPQDHLLRRIIHKVDFSFVYSLARSHYKVLGRPSVDPVMLVKMLLLGYLYGIDSERRLEQEINYNLLYRWFLGMNLTDKVPDHTTLSYNRRRRFGGTEFFRQVFEKIVQVCKEYGLVSNSVVTDSTHVRANANRNSAEAHMVTKSPSQYYETVEQRARELDRQLVEQRAQKAASSEQTAGEQQQKPKRRVPFRAAKTKTYKEIRSKTDPDAKLMYRPGKEVGLYYLTHITTEVSNRIILDILSSVSNIYDHEVYAECIKRVSQQHEIKEAAADGAYNRAEVHKTLADLQITGYIPAKTWYGKPDDEFKYYTHRRFEYDAETDTYLCPNGQTLWLTAVRGGKDIRKVYSCSASTCGACELRAKCRHSGPRRLERIFDQEHMDAARALNGTPQYELRQKQRRVVCEGNNATLKAKHSLDRAKGRGLESMQQQGLLAATALNLWHLARAS